MKSFKLVFAILALAIGFGAPIAKAQDAKRQNMADKAKTTYNLTDDQYKKVKAIYKDATDQKKALADDSTKKAKESEINAATQAKVREVLTPEQQAKFDELAKKPAGKGKGNANGKGEGKGKGDSKKQKTQD